MSTDHATLNTPIRQWLEISGMFGLKNMRIGARLAVGFGALLVLILASGVFALIGQMRLEASTRDIADHWLVGVQTLNEARDAANGVRNATMRSVLADDDLKQTLRQAHDNKVREYAAALANYEKTVKGPEAAQLLQAIKDAWGRYLIVDAEILSMPAGSDNTDARGMAVSTLTQAFQNFDKAIQKDVVRQIDGSAMARDQAAKVYRTDLIVVGVVAALSVLLGLIVQVLITRSIIGPLKKAVSVAENVAQGDLTTHIVVHGNDEAAQLLAALRSMVSNLAGLIGKVRGGSAVITTGVTEIAAGSTDLSTRTEQQATFLQQTAAAMQQLTATVRNNADNARQAHGSAQATSHLADDGSNLMEQAVGTMNAIRTASHRMSDIVGTIEGIAFQTNILALNAAVEAARAGAEGRGFAVVAQEVRVLAQRSADAAREIKDLIGEAVSKIDNGGQLVDHAGQNMSQIVIAIQEVTRLMAEISRASDEQTKGIEEVNSAVGHMDEMTQQNATMVEQVASASASMQQQTSVLEGAVQAFRLAAA